MSQLDELLKLMLELEKRIEKLEEFGREYHEWRKQMAKEAKECFGKIEGIM